MRSRVDHASAIQVSEAAIKGRQPDGWVTELATPGAIPALDGLRAFAIILVLARHAVRPFWDANNHALVPVGSWDLAIPLVNGWIGVDLFFVLSGFLIGRQLLGARARNERGSKALGRYVLRRMMRILPAYYAVLGLAVLGIVPYYTVSSEDIEMRTAWHVLMMQDYFPPDIVVAFFSLGVEEKFYLVAPFIIGLIFLIKSDSARYVVVGLLASLGLLSRYLTDRALPETISYGEFFAYFRWPFHVCLEPLMLGILLAVIYKNPRHSKSKRVLLLDRYQIEVGRVFGPTLFWGGCVAVGALLFGEPMLDEISEKDRIWQNSLIAVSMTILVGGAVMGGAPRWLAMPWLVVTARLSYVIYLVHLMVIPWASVVVESILGAGGSSRLVQFVLFVPIYVALSVALGLAVHLAVERPFLKLRDRIA